MSDTTWRQELASAMEVRDDPGPIVAVAPDEDVLDVVFDDYGGGSEGPAVLIWTETKVYFPVVYDGSEWLGSAPRNPQSSAQGHVGSE